MFILIAGTADRNQQHIEISCTHYHPGGALV